ncbi:hypothetical protein R3P38DRAFT_3198328 [Favolaschia claudopus]|uniref:Uncharacterized protein n=1 Tax=Favolaschia claudopus TaxID=2862362 RepID=A0AAW0B3Z3_9AGAR
MSTITVPQGYFQSFSASIPGQADSFKELPTSRALSCRRFSSSHGKLSKFRSIANWQAYPTLVVRHFVAFLIETCRTWFPVYAEKAEMDASPAAVKFNCVQRAHANTLENIPTVYLMTILVGIKAPVVAASALGAWVVSRIAFTNGYASGNPAQRHNLIGRLTYLPSTLTLFLGSIWSVYSLIADGI